MPRQRLEFENSLGELLLACEEIMSCARLTLDDDGTYWLSNIREDLDDLKQSVARAELEINKLMPETEA